MGVVKIVHQRIIKSKKYFLYLLYKSPIIHIMKKKDIYSIHKKHYVAVDCVIFGYEDETLKVLLYPRSFEPSVGKWSLLGGFVEG